MLEGTVDPNNSHPNGYHNGSNGNGNSRGRVEMHPAIAQAYNSDTRNRIYGMILGIVRNKADADELLNDTFKCANRGYANFRGDSQLDTWLYRIATNLSRNRLAYWKRRRRESTMSLDMETEDGDGQSGSITDLISFQNRAPEDTVQYKLELGEIEERIARGITHLSEKHREILILAGIENRSYEEISAKLGINVGTVKSRIARARNDLYKKIYGPDTARPPSKTSSKS